MAQNIYDNPVFFEGYSQLARQRLGLDSAPEWPLVRSMLPPVMGKRVVDLGCGFGWASKHFSDQGAASVLGLDLSENMIQRARETNSGEGIEYQIADLEALELPDASFDLAYSSLAFHYVQDFGCLVRVIRTALVPSGNLVFTIEHPIYMAAVHPHWMVDEDGRKTWPVNRYSVEGERRTNWLANGVIKYHRTVATSLNTLVRSGFEIRRVEEFTPTDEQVRENPRLAEEIERPMFLMVVAQSVGNPTSPFWVPDVRSEAFKSAAYRQSLLVASSPGAAEDQAFIDSISEYFGRAGDEPEFEE